MTPMPDTSGPESSTSTPNPAAPLLGAVALLVGLSADYQYQLIGRLYLGELLLPMLGLLAALSARGRRVLSDGLFWAFSVAALVSLTGYVLSDVMAGTDVRNALRGWARVFFLLSDLVALALLASASTGAFRLFVIGWALGRIALAVAAGIPMVAGEWKLAYAASVSLLVLAIAPIISLRLAALAIAATGFLHLLFDTRTAGATLFLIAALVWLRASRPAAPLRIGRSLPAIALAGVVIAGLIAFGLAQTEEAYGSRRATSNVSRLVSLSVGAQAIAESPWIGRGSWALSSELGEIAHREARSRLSGPERQQLQRYSYIPESQIVASWFEGGILGAAFFLLLGPTLLIYLYRVAAVRPLDAMSALLLYFLLSSSWAWLMSPFGSSRIPIALAVASIILVRVEQKSRPSHSVDAVSSLPGHSGGSVHAQGSSRRSSINPRPLRHAPGRASASVLRRPGA